MAFPIKKAATVESTPPDTAHITFLSPTLSLISLIIFSGFSLRILIFSLHTSFTKYSRISVPFSVWSASG